MFGIGFPELILILALALIVVGPDKLPDFARSIAKTLVDLRKTAEGLKSSFEAEDNPLSEIKPQLEDAARNFKETVLDAKDNTLEPPADLAKLDPAGKAAEHPASPECDEPQLPSTAPSSDNQPASPDKPAEEKE
ncbi:twin-arginine translocase TatA/TatE family subunit [Desulfopila inferna]|uniref:twin-arginine translocase TatA/TatE family subunit n=1 Tax=Desulfopila inferna TaxID=468528 RepID=UPI0019667714|nr:twin-arginine translocase TatA/TatE family subunit [Desulfopila inferna]MBM9603155.1 twin-arginine translocase TatA/TatE family subunit [Desulfopila inferna]